jgi:hypothetical protein
VAVVADRVLRQPRRLVRDLRVAAG